MNYSFKLLNHETAYSGFHHIEIYDLKFNKFDGSESNVIRRELSRRKSCVGLLPYDPQKNQVVLVEQIRLGPLANNEHPWMLEVIAGIIEDDESKENTVLREASEEANCTVRNLIPILEYYTTPGGCSEKMSLYFGLTDVEKLGGIHGLSTEDEDIKTHIINFDQTLDMIRNGQINNASTIIALQWLALNKKFLTFKSNNSFVRLI